MRDIRRRRGWFSCSPGSFLCRVAQRVGTQIESERDHVLVPLWLVIVLERHFGTGLWWSARHPREGTTGQAARISEELIRDLQAMNTDALKRRATLAEYALNPSQQESYLKVPLRSEDAVREALETEDWE